MVELKLISFRSSSPRTLGGESLEPFGELSPGASNPDVLTFLIPKEIQHQVLQECGQWKEDISPFRDR